MTARPRRQRTLAGPAETSGPAIFSGGESRVRVSAAPVDSGIVFVRADLPGRPRIPARAQWLTGGVRWSGLGRAGHEVRMVEHLLSAAYGMGVENLLVETWGREMPIGDGSAATYVDLIKRAGVISQDAPSPAIGLDEPVIIGGEDASIRAVPHAGGLRITHTLDYGARYFGRQTLTVDVTPDVYVDQIAPARTYVLRPEIERFREQGLGKGASLDNIIIVEEDGAISGDQRFDDECVRHKIADILGDLCLVGCRLHAHVAGSRSGHALNQRLARHLAGLSQGGGGATPGSG